ncbi:hypothetical protein [Paraglaciecola sp.]|uniref:hypothetical protein n=1 Tax=Paraglaciecola sp. TaxID=1920173 RepID=UPI003EF51BF1
MGKRKTIRTDPDILNLLSRLPAETANSLTNEQLQHLKVAIGSGQFRKHKIDIRGTLPVPFYPSRIYFVFLMGRNIRSLSRQEKAIALSHMLLMLTLLLTFSLGMGLTLLYLLKSALGINLLEGFSLGLWDWVKQLLGD